MFMRVFMVIAFAPLSLSVTHTLTHARTRTHTHTHTHCPSKPVTRRRTVSFATVEKRRRRCCCFSGERTPCAERPINTALRCTWRPLATTCRSCRSCCRWTSTSTPRSVRLALLWVTWASTFCYMGLYSLSHFGMFSCGKSCLFPFQRTARRPHRANEVCCSERVGRCLFFRPCWEMFFFVQDVLGDVCSSGRVGKCLLFRMYLVMFVLQDVLDDVCSSGRVGSCLFFRLCWEIFVLQDVLADVCSSGCVG